MRHSLLLLILFAAGCKRSGPPPDGAGADSSRHAEGRAIPAAAFRLGGAGTGLAVYSLPRLDSTPWGAGGRVSGARSAIGVDMVGGRLLFRDSSGAVASFDLVSLRQRQIAPRRTSTAIGADGALLAVDSLGAITESQPWGVRTWPGVLGRGIQAVFAAPGPRLLAVRRTRSGDSLAIVARESGVSSATAVPQANDIAASRDGDAVAFATDSGLVVFEDRDLEHPWFVRLAGNPSAVMFSPSGHRLYAALAGRNALAVVDRFAQDERGSISLPGRAGALRNDPWGRAVLVRDAREESGETWVVGVADGKVTGRLKGSWASDLPAVTQSGVVLSREGDGVVARDLRSFDSLGVASGAARDIWFSGRWVPSSASARAVAATGARQPAEGRAEPAAAPAASRQAAAASPQPAAANRPPAAASAPLPAGPAPAAASREMTASFYTQLLATRSEEAARSLAANLAGEQVHVLAPRQGVGDDNWRVVAGPFRSREAADSAGRSLGRPYWVVDRSRDARP